LYLFFFFLVTIHLPEAVRLIPQRVKGSKKAFIVLALLLDVIVIVVAAGPSGTAVRFLGLEARWVLLLGALLLTALSGALYARRSADERPALRLPPALAWALKLALGFVLVLGWAKYAAYVSDISYLHPSPEDRALLAYLETLPKDALIGGYPCALNNVQLFAKRQSTFTCEQPGATDEQIFDTFRAYYTDDPQALLTFCTENDIDYLVANELTFTPAFWETKHLFFEPYSTEIKSTLWGRERFVLREIPAERRLFVVGHFYVLPCDEATLSSTVVP
jgi:hypothetical protein